MEGDNTIKHAKEYHKFEFYAGLIIIIPVAFIIAAIIAGYFITYFMIPK